MPDEKPARLCFGWPEWLLALAVVALFFQVFPSLWWAMLAALDPRAWSRVTWFALNLLVLAVLFGVRFGPELYADWRMRRAKSAGRGRRPTSESGGQHDADYEARLRAAAEWRERAKGRRPWM